MIFLYLFDLALFLLPGFALLSRLASRRPMRPVISVIVVAAVSASLGYAAFWAFFFSRTAGRVFSFAVYGASLALILLSRREAKRVVKLAAEPFCYLAVAGLCYLCFFFMFTNPAKSGGSHAQERFFEEFRPGDNVIPMILADRFYRHKPVRPFCCGNWLSSDRPPLQSGIFLLQHPVRLAGTGELNYEVLTAALQALWICGVWCLLTALETSRRRICQVLGFLVFSGFFFYNTVYTWPKFLAASFILFILSIMIEVIRERRPATRNQCILAAVCLGLTLMSHPGSVFSLPALAVIGLRFRKLFPIRGLAVALLIVIGFALPWSAYQKYFDPPGNRLLKMHLAGQIAIDSRSTWQTLQDAYKNQSLAKTLGFKWSNIARLGGRKPLDTFGLDSLRFSHGISIDRTATESSRIAQREYIFNAVGVLNLGWIAAVIVLLFRRYRPAVPFAGWMIGAALVNFLTWSLVVFGPTDTETTHSSYADIILLSVGLAGFILALPRLVSLVLMGLQVFNLFVVWIWSAPSHFRIFPGLSEPVIQIPLLLCGCVLSAYMLWQIVRAYVLPKARALAESKLGKAAQGPSLEHESPVVS